MQLVRIPPVGNGLSQPVGLAEVHPQPPEEAPEIVLAGEIEMETGTKVNDRDESLGGRPGGRTVGRSVKGQCVPYERVRLPPGIENPLRVGGAEVPHGSSRSGEPGLHQRERPFRGRPASRPLNGVGHREAVGPGPQAEAQSEHRERHEEPKGRDEGEATAVGRTDRRSMPDHLLLPTATSMGSTRSGGRLSPVRVTSMPDGSRERLIQLGSHPRCPRGSEK